MMSGIDNKWALYAASEERAACIVALKDLFALSKGRDATGFVSKSLGKAALFNSAGSDTMLCLPAELDPRPFPITSPVKERVR